MDGLNGFHGFNGDMQCAIAYQFIIEFSHLGYREAKEDESVVVFYHRDE